MLGMLLTPVHLDQPIDDCEAPPLRLFIAFAYI
jgi:hypothetical protein